MTEEGIRYLVLGIREGARWREGWLISVGTPSLCSGICPPYCHVVVLCENNRFQVS